MGAFMLGFKAHNPMAYHAVFTDGVIIESLDVRTVYEAGRLHVRGEKGFDSGVIGGILYAPDGRGIFQWVSGRDTMLEDTDITPRLVWALKRGLQEAGMEWRAPTVGDCYDMVVSGRLKVLRNCGRETFMELVKLLVKYCGVETPLTIQLLELGKRYKWEGGL